jgi:hypothetical protein
VIGGTDGFGCLGPAGLVVESQTCAVFPLGASAADLAGGDSRTSETEVCGSGNGNTHSRFDQTTHDEYGWCHFSERMLESLPLE